MTSLETCKVPGCDGQYLALGMCLKHYTRHRRYGDPNGFAPVKTLRERFEEKYEIDPDTGCWIWKASFTAKGYGRIEVESQVVGAHRVSWELFKGPIPDELCVLHRCDNPPCVNPEHLFLGTVADNNKDMTEKGRRRWNERALRVGRAATPSLKGEAHPMATLTQKRVNEIKRRLAMGQRGTDIATSVGTSVSIVSKIKTGKTWR
jgi:hypothetical protein